MENISSSEYKATPEVKGRAAYQVKNSPILKTFNLSISCLTSLNILVSLSLAFQENSLTIGGVIDAIELADFQLVELKNWQIFS